MEKILENGGSNIFDSFLKKFKKQSNKQKKLSINIKKINLY